MGIGLRFRQASAGLHRMGLGGCCAALESGHFVALESGHFVALERGHFAALESGHFVALESGRYAALESGHFVALESGRYAALVSGRCVALESGRYAALVSGHFVALVSGRCVAFEGGRCGLGERPLRGLGVVNLSLSLASCVMGQARGADNSWEIDDLVDVAAIAHFPVVASKVAQPPPSTAAERPFPSARVHSPRRSP